MSFSEFSKEHVVHAETPKQDVPESNNDSKNEEYLKQKYDQLKNKNENELMNDLFDEVARQKSDGKFDYESLANSVEAMSPFLTPEQYSNIKNLLKKIK